MFVGFVHTTLLVISIKQVQFYGKKEKDQTMSTPLPLPPYTAGDLRPHDEYMDSQSDAPESSCEGESSITPDAV